MASAEGTDMDSCGKHPHEIGVAICRRCGGSWCRDCLVYAFGPKKPPFCMGCAMVAGGVRTAGARPALSRRELKARMKAAKVEAKQAAKQPAAAPEPDDADLDVATEPVHAAVDLGGGTDWATPWWEDRQPTLAD
jgi:hypothetical protein